MLTKLIPNIKMLIQKVFKERHHKKKQLFRPTNLIPNKSFC